MKTASVILAAAPSIGDVAAFVQRLPGGYWQAPSRSEGGVDGPEGCVYVSYDDQFGTYWRDVLAPAEQVRVLTALGHDPRLAVHLHLSSVGSSERLAREVAERIVAAWGGVVLI